MPRIYVALDLETTGLDPTRDAIIEIGAVKFQGERVLGTYSTLVNPGRHIPLEITELTGIHDRDLIGAPRLQAVLPELIRFVGDAPIVGHSVSFDLGFLRQHSTAFQNESYDTFELATVLFPTLGRYSLSELSGHFGIRVERAHRALHDALATQALFQTLLRSAATLPSRILEEIRDHAQRAGWLAVGFFQEAIELASLTEPNVLSTDQLAQQSLRRNGRRTFDEEIAPLIPSPNRQLLDEDELASLLMPGGRFASQFPGYEHRPQQCALLRRITQAFNRGDHLLVEAPTGVGKSLAYLLPAAYWAVQNGERVIISTHTVHLQEQLLDKDFPQVASLLPFACQAAVLKGRAHYLCPARLTALRRYGPTTPDEARVLTKILIWQLGSTQVDGDALFLQDATEQAIWRELSAEHADCNPERCDAFQRNQCYFYRARRRAESAHLVIVNHALLLADAMTERRVLPTYKHLVVDEAHQLEAAATSSLSIALSQQDFVRLLHRLGNVTASGRVTGLLAEALSLSRQTCPDDQSKTTAELLIGGIGIAVSRAFAALEVLFERLTSVVNEHSESHPQRYDLRLRITPALRCQPAWDAVEIAWDETKLPLSRIAGSIQRLAHMLTHVHHVSRSCETLCTELRSIGESLARATRDLDEIVAQPSPSFVYWITVGPDTQTISLHKAPVRVDSLLEEHVFRDKDTVILTSATLRVANTFEFVRGQLGAWRADEFVVGSPFDYRQSTLVYLIDDIPEPEQPGYQRAVEKGLVALFRATQGRGLGLFTSHSQLRATLRAIRGPLAQAGITVQAQGEGVSRRQLIENFRSGERRVLLGTRSFWEGIDVVGEALSCLAIVKLPFSVPTDPIFAARAETFDNPFTEYAVPESVLQFLQGFGRLIRSRSDRGVVAVFDTRLLTKGYGEIFLRSLPGPTIRQGPLAELPSAAKAWLDGVRTPSGEMATG